MTQTDAILRLLRDVIGDDLIGAYAHGSAVLGELRPRSDIDVLGVTRRRTTPDQRRALAVELLRISGGGPPRGARPVELTLVVQSDVRPWRYPPRREFQFGEWHRRGLESGADPGPPGPDPDLAPLVSMALLGDRALLGPPPSQVLDSVPDADVRRAIVAAVPGLLADLEGDTTNVILTLARIWTTLSTGEIRTKDAAADRLLAQLPQEHRAVLARARSNYLRVEEEGWDDLRASVVPFADYVVGEIGRLSAAGQTSPR